MTARSVLRMMKERTCGSFGGRSRTEFKQLDYALTDSSNQRLDAGNMPSECVGAAQR